MQHHISFRNLYDIVIAKTKESEAYNMTKNLTLSYKDAHGTIDYGMTNDYMFRAVLQENKIVLKGLICSLLHLKDSEVSSVEITNPIQLGKSIDSKTFVLDIHVILNNDRIVNLEMQMTNLTSVW